MDEIERGRRIASAHDDVRCLGPIVKARRHTPRQIREYWDALQLLHGVEYQADRNELFASDVATAETESFYVYNGMVPTSWFALKWACGIMLVIIVLVGLVVAMSVVAQSLSALL